MWSLAWMLLQGAVPTVISFTGQLRDASGTPYSPPCSVQVEILDNLGGTTVWGPVNYDNCTDSQGSFNLILGSDPANPLNLEPGREYYLILRVDKNSATYTTADVVFGDDNPSGDVIIVHSGANDEYVLSEGDEMTGNLTIKDAKLILQDTTNGDSLILDATTPSDGSSIESHGGKLYINSSSAQDVVVGSSANPISFHLHKYLTLYDSGAFYLRDASDPSGTYLYISKGSAFDLKSVNAPLFINSDTGQDVSIGSSTNPVGLHLHKYLTIYDSGAFYLRDASDPSGTYFYISKGTAFDLKSVNAPLFINSDTGQDVQFFSGASPANLNINLDNSHHVAINDGVLNITDTAHNKSLRMWAYGSGVDLESMGGILCINHNEPNWVQIGSDGNRITLAVHNTVDIYNSGRIVLRDDTNPSSTYLEIARGGEFDIKSHGANIFMNYGVPHRVQVGGGGQGAFLSLPDTGIVFGDEDYSDDGTGATSPPGSGPANTDVWYDSECYIGLGKNFDLTISQLKAQWMRFRNLHSDWVWIDADSDGDGVPYWKDSGDSENVVMKLTASGELYIDGNYHSGGADFAELFKAEEKLEPGDVVVIAGQGKVKKSRLPLDKRVVGVVSEKPAIIGNCAEGGSEDEVPVAFLGQVRVKVCDENGPIQPGDLLVTSSIPGYAMKAPENPKPGIIIGKALEPFQKGKGEILVLVTLK